jgi:hypothetical protein
MFPERLADSVDEEHRTRRQKLAFQLHFDIWPRKAFLEMTERTNLTVQNSVLRVTFRNEDAKAMDNSSLGAKVSWFGNEQVAK